MNIVPTNEIERLRKFLDFGLYEYNKKYNSNIIHPDDKREFGFSVSDNSGELQGGVCGYVDSGNWLWVEYLYLNEKCRGKDVGSALMKEIENFAVENKCVGIHLYTWEWQARVFYEKNGFSYYGELKNHPTGNKAYYMEKYLLEVK